MRRVAVTGTGVICPLGNSAAEALQSAVAGRSAIRRLETDWTPRLLAPLAATVHFDADQHFDPPRLRMLDRVSQFAVIAARQALSEAQLPLASMQRERVGVFVGTGVGGALTTDEGYQRLYWDRSDRIKPFTVLMSMANAPAAWIAMEQQLTGPTLTCSTACSSSTVSVGEAWMRVASGQLDAAIAGGAEAPLCFGVMKAWEALHALASPDPQDPSASCKPFSRDRTGLVLAEGAAMVVLEEWEQAVRRGARIQGELLGYGLATDIGHITRPSVAGQAAAMQAALRSAQCAPEEIDAINAHGTGTPANDGVETAAIKQVFGQAAWRIPVSSTKSMHGHLLGASGALELVLSLLAMEQQVLLPTMHLHQRDPECDLDYVPNEARHHIAVRTMLSSSFAFGGTNAVVVARAAH
jgi:3-oxoacyl-[acyl-carrier-protein] synthase II